VFGQASQLEGIENVKNYLAMEDGRNEEQENKEKKAKQHKKRKNTSLFSSYESDSLINRNYVHYS
jgi:hypothetical protein